MWKRAATYDPDRGTFFSWSLKIARNKAIDRLRARQRGYKLSEAAATEAAAVPPVSAATPDDLVSQRDEDERVRAALSRIAPTQVDVIRLAFFGGLTQTEIAEKLGAPLGTVKARIRRGLLALRAELVTARSVAMGSSPTSKRVH
ncbi:MAG: sigma-70 family RNA polymerase sigma factor, partial [Chthoniobacterales bacterium]